VAFITATGGISGVGEMTDEVVIRTRENGPLLVTGNIKLVDAAGQPFDLSGKPNVALCRCGASQKKPFCDGTHKTTGFQANESAQPTPAGE
jgi:CDGSH-type Zn-finger protein